MRHAIRSNLFLIVTPVILCKDIFLADAVKAETMGNLSVTLLVCDCCASFVAEDLIHFLEGESFGLRHLNDI